MSMRLPGPRRPVSSVRGEECALPALTLVGDNDLRALRLLDGCAPFGAGCDSLVALLADACVDADAMELRGESEALAAFRAQQIRTRHRLPLPDVSRRVAARRAVRPVHRREAGLAPLVGSTVAVAASAAMMLLANLGSVHVPQLGPGTATVSPARAASDRSTATSPGAADRSGRMPAPAGPSTLPPAATPAVSSAVPTVGVLPDQAGSPVPGGAEVAGGLATRSVDGGAAEPTGAPQPTIGPDGGPDGAPQAGRTGDAGETGGVPRQTPSPGAGGNRAGSGPAGSADGAVTNGPTSPGGTSSSPVPAASSGRTQPGRSHGRGVPTGGADRISLRAADPAGPSPATVLDRGDPGSGPAGAATTGAGSTAGRNGRAAQGPAAQGRATRGRAPDRTGDRAGQAGQTVETGTTGTTDRSNRSGRTGRTSPSGRTAQTGQPDRTGRDAATGRAAQDGRVEPGTAGRGRAARQGAAGGADPGRIEVAGPPRVLAGPTSPAGAEEALIPRLRSACRSWLDGGKGQDRARQRLIPLIGPGQDPDILCSDPAVTGR